MRRSVVIAAAAVALGGCGIGGAERTVTVTRTVPAAAPSVEVPAVQRRGRALDRAAWTAAADRTCGAALERGRRLLAGLGGLDPEDEQLFERLAGVYGDVAAVHRDWLGDLQALNPDAGALEPAAALEANVRTRLVLVERMQAAFGRRDGATASVLQGELYRVLDRAGAIRREQGFTSCGKGTPQTVAG